MVNFKFIFFINKKKLNVYFFLKALRISMEEQRRVQEAEIGRGTGSEGGQQNPPSNTGTSSK